MMFFYQPPWPRMSGVLNAARCFLWAPMHPNNVPGPPRVDALLTAEPVSEPEAPSLLSPPQPAAQPAPVMPGPIAKAPIMATSIVSEIESVALTAIENFLANPSGTFADVSAVVQAARAEAKTPSVANTIALVSTIEKVIADAEARGAQTAIAATAQQQTAAPQPQVSA